MREARDELTAILEGERAVKEAAQREAATLQQVLSEFQAGEGRHIAEAVDREHRALLQANANIQHLSNQNEQLQVTTEFLLFFTIFLFLEFYEKYMLCR